MPTRKASGYCGSNPPIFFRSLLPLASVRLFQSNPQALVVAREVITRSGQPPVQVLCQFRGELRRPPLEAIEQITPHEVRRAALTLIGLREAWGGASR
jgi:hypothetical protein